MPLSRVQRPKAPGSAFLIHLLKGDWCVGFDGIDVGHRVRVQLTHTDVEQGFIDFHAT